MVRKEETSYRKEFHYDLDLLEHESTPSAAAAAVNILNFTELRKKKPRSQGVANLSSLTNSSRPSITSQLQPSNRKMYSQSKI